MIKKALNNFNSKKICKNFVENFSRLKHKKIILYGIGPVTEILVNRLKEFNIIGLMDPNRSLQNKIIYKKKNLTFGNVVKAKPIIIIVAKENTSFQIYREIKDFVDKNDIKTFYLNGKSAFLKKNNFQIKNFKKFDIKKIKRKIKKSSYVSFDIFDTILNRKVIRPHDIFHLIEFKIINQLNLKIDFASKRIRIENLLFEKQKNTYNLDDVYESFHKKYKINRTLLNKIKKIEIDFEIKFSEPRNEIVKIYKYCRNLKKKDFFISDIYFDSM